MGGNLKRLDAWMREKEGENLEFKEARNDFGLDKLTRYCAALSNEGGGMVILGVSDRRPRRVVGSKAFPQPEETRKALNERLRIRIDFEVIPHPEGRVLVFHVPSRPAGVAIGWKGEFWIRENDSLVGMSSENLRKIFEETGHDFSADFCEGLRIDDLDVDSIEEFRRRWIQKSKKSGIQSLTEAQLLEDIEAVRDGSATFAALILFGKRSAVRDHLPQAEVVYEYRSSDASGPAQERREYQEGFFAWYDGLWERINLRNDIQNYQNGPFVLDVPTFDERAIREAVLNAVSHRDYQLGGSVFIRQYPERIEIVSPGGLPVEVALENILDRQSPRNRRIAEIFSKCGLVERAGQGVNLMFEAAIRQSKPRPSFEGTDQHTVFLTLRGRVQNAAFIRYMDSFDGESLNQLATGDWMALDLLSREETLPDDLAPRTERLLDLGMIARAGKGRFILNEDYYRFTGRESTFRRLRENEEKKEFLERHLLDHAVDGCSMGELEALSTGLDRKGTRKLLDELREEGRVHLRGDKRAARWYPREATEGG